MSLRNGDKARSGKEQKKKLLRRKRTLAVRQSLAQTAQGTAMGNTVSLESPKASGQESTDAPTVS